jgi:ABC-2 type transport system permease protein
VLYWSYLKILVKSQLQYRLSFVLLTAGQLLVPFFVFAGIVLMFQRFGSLGGWTAAEVCVGYGVTHMAFALAQAFARGFDTFSGLIRSGEFDRVLVRPRGTVVQVLGSRLDLTRIGRLCQGVAVLVWALAQLPIAWESVKVFLLVSMVLSGTVLFCGLFQLGAVLCFKTVDGLEVVNIFTDGGREASQYPLSVYPRAVARVLTFVVPFGCFNYIPLVWLLGKPGASMVAALVSPWLGLLFLVPCALAWRWGVRHYLSTGS